MTRSILFFILIIFTNGNIFSEDVKTILNHIVSSHPELKTIESTTKSIYAQSKHADVLPDPKIGLAMRNYPYYGSPNFDDKRINSPAMTGQEIMISQEIPFPGKLSQSRKIVERKAKESSFSAIGQKNKLARDLLVSIIQKKSFEEKLIVRAKTGELYKSLERISKTYNSTGKKQFYLALNSAANHTGNKIRIVELSSDLEAIKAELEQLSLSEPDSMTELLKTDIYSFLDSQFLNFHTTTNDHGLQHAEKNPVIQRRKEERRRAEEEKVLNDFFGHAPDAEFFVSYMKRRNQKFMVDTGPVATATGNWMIQDSTEFRGDLFSAGVTFKIPLWSSLNYKHSKEMSEENSKSSEYALDRDIRVVNANLKRLFAQSQFLKEALDLTKNKLIPELEKAAHSSEESYKSGKAEYADVIAMRLELQIGIMSAIELKEKYYTVVTDILELTDFIL
jgi:hypothetical protein